MSNYRRNGKRGAKTPKSPCKIKTSTPIEDHVAPRIANNIPVNVSKLDLDKDFPEIGELSVSSDNVGDQRKRRMKPTLLSTSVNSFPVNPVFGQKVEFTKEGEESPFMVAEVEQRETSDNTRGDMLRELQSLSTPFKSSSASAKTPNKTPTVNR